MYCKLIVLLLFVSCCTCTTEDSYPPSIVVHPPPNTTVTETKSIQFTCAAYGLPLPTITWTKGTTELTSNSIPGYQIHTQDLTLGNTTFAISVLEIDGVNSAAEGEFGCHADNGIPDIDNQALSESSANFSLIVDDTALADSEPAIIVDRPLDQMVDHGSTVEALCVAYGNPLPAISWFKVVPCNDSQSGECTRELMDTVYYAVAEYGNSAVSKSVLQLWNVSRENDTGTYRCTARNNDDGGNLSSSDWYLNVSARVYVPTNPETETGNSCRTDDSRIYQIAIAIMVAVIVVMAVVLAIILCYLATRAFNEHKLKIKTTRGNRESTFSYPTSTTHVATSHHNPQLPNFSRPVAMRRQGPVSASAGLTTNPIYGLRLTYPPEQSSSQDSVTDNEESEEEDSYTVQSVNA